MALNTLRPFLTTFVLAAAVAVPASAAPKMFEIMFEDIAGAGRVCNVAFFGQPPPPTTVDRIVRSALESAVLVDSAKDILGMAFVGDSAMKETEYSGPLVYKAADKRIMTMDEFRGIKSCSHDTGAYYVETKEEKTLEGITPERRWLSLTLVFPETPAIQQAYGAAQTEAEKAASRGLDANVYVSVGAKATRTSWRQLRDPSGGYVFLEYQASTKTIKRKAKVLKRLQ